MDDLNEYLDIYRGQMKNDELIVNNVNSGSAFPDGDDGHVYGELHLKENEDKSFQILANTSLEPDGPWSPYMRINFVPTE